MITEPNTKKAQRTILVTGGGGFIGSHLCDKLLSAGHKVVCLDDLSTGSQNNIKHLLSNHNFEFIQKDVAEPIGISVDEIFNLACPASPKHYQNDPIKTCKTSILGALNLLDLATYCDAKIYQASTSEVYGDPNVSPQKESYHGNVNPIGLRACYDEGKRCAETLFFDFHRQKKTKIKVGRTFNTYGPRMQVSDGRVVSNFIVQALTNKPMTVYGDGTQSRSFCYVDDQVNGILSLMNSDLAITGPINIGMDIEITMLELAGKIAGLTGTRSKVETLALPEDDPKQRRPDIQKAKELLGWQPTTSLDDGLAATISYFDKLLSGHN